MYVVGRPSFLAGQFQNLKQTFLFRLNFYEKGTLIVKNNSACIFIYAMYLDARYAWRDNEIILI